MFHRGVDLQHPLLQSAGNVDGPARVAEVALELPQDGGHGVAREGVAAASVEAVNRLQQREARNLDKVIERLPRMFITTRQAVGEREKSLDELFSRGDVSVLEACEEPLLFAPRGPRRA